MPADINAAREVLAKTPIPHGQLRGWCESWLDEIEALRAERDRLKGAMDAQDQRERAAGERCGIDYNLYGCDWPDGVAEALVCSRRDRDLLKQERDELRAALDALHCELAAAHAANKELRGTQLAEVIRLADDRDRYRDAARRLAEVCESIKPTTVIIDGCMGEQERTTWCLSLIHI